MRTRLHLRDVLVSRHDVLPHLQKSCRWGERRGGGQRSGMQMHLCMPRMFVWGGRTTEGAATGASRQRRAACVGFRFRQGVPTGAHGHGGRGRSLGHASQTALPLSLERPFRGATAGDTALWETSRFSFSVTPSLPFATTWGGLVDATFKAWCAPLAVLSSMQHEVLPWDAAHQHAHCERTRP